MQKRFLEDQRAFKPKGGPKWLIFRYKEASERESYFLGRRSRESMKNSWRLSMLCVEDSSSHPTKSVSLLSWACS